MTKRSLAFIMPAAAASGLEIEISHVEARRLIRAHELPHCDEEWASDHDVGTWEKRPDGRYFIHFHT